MKPTIESITKKLGFDPRYPPKREFDPWKIDDVTPRIGAQLEPEELAFVIELLTGERLEP